MSIGSEICEEHYERVVIPKYKRAVSFLIRMQFALNNIELDSEDQEILDELNEILEELK